MPASSVKAALAWHARNGQPRTGAAIGGTERQRAGPTRVLPQGSAEPGPWRSERTPYMTPIVRAFVDPRYRRIVAVIAAQMGKTEAIFNVMGHRLDDDPTPILYIGPSQKLVES